LEEEQGSSQEQKMKCAKKGKQDSVQERPRQQELRDKDVTSKK